MQSSNKATPIIIGSLAIAAIIGVGGFIYVSGTSTKQASNSTVTESSVVPTSDKSTPASTTDTTAPIPASTTANGTYTASTNYSVPQGFQNTIKVTVTVDDGTISAVSATHEYEDAESEFYLDAFDGAITAAVGGDKLEDAFAGRVGGASLTSGAFNDALQTIINDAKT